MPVETATFIVAAILAAEAEVALAALVPNLCLVVLQVLVALAERQPLLALLSLTAAEAEADHGVLPVALVVLVVAELASLVVRLLVQLIPVLMDLEAVAVALVMPALTGKPEETVEVVA